MGSIGAIKARASAKQVVPIKWNPKRHHKLAVSFVVDKGAGGLLLDPGLGKTSITYKIFCILRAAGVVNTLWVIAPLRPCWLVWPKEQKKWLDFAGLKVEVLHGPDKENAIARKADVYVVNPDGFKWLVKHPLFKKKAKGQLLAVDESSKFRNSQSLRFKLLKEVLQLFKRRMILTGSPAPKSLEDLFGQIYILDMGRALGQFITHYRMKYFTATGYGGYSYVPTDKKAEQAIYKAISPLCLRLSEKEYLNLPPMIGRIDGKEPVIIEVELPEKARRAYDSMEALMFAEMDKGRVSAANAAVAMMKCEQIANGGLYKDEDPEKRTRGERPWSWIHNEKLEAAKDYVEELGGHPCLISYQFHHDLARLMDEEHGFGAMPYIGTGVSMKETIQIEEHWNLGDIPAMPVNPQSIAHGLNLQGGRAVLWHSIIWNYEEYDQLIRRIYRQGQKYPCLTAHIVARDTVDEVKLEVLRGKGMRQQKLFDALRSYQKQKQ